MLHPETVVADLALTMLVGFAGAVGAWVLRRRTTLSARNLYPPAAAGALSLAGAIGLSAWNAALVLLPLVSPWVAGAIVGARWRSSDLGAGEELRNHELGRRWIWQPAAEDRDGERLYLRSQGELVRERPWPRSLAYVSMTAMEKEGPRLPLGAGQHVVLFGATGAGKTTTARRLIAARTLHDHSALLVLDQKGDPEDVEHMKQLAAEAGVPFILFDSQDPATDRWQPLWGSASPTAFLPAMPVQVAKPGQARLVGVVPRASSASRGRQSRAHVRDPGAVLDRGQHLGPVGGVPYRGGGEGEQFLHTLVLGDLHRLVHERAELPGDTGRQPVPVLQVIADMELRLVGEHRQGPPAPMGVDYQKVHRIGADVQHT